MKYLGDVQVYGEYDRCRGRAVRHFHETMAKIEAEHYSREKGRKVERDPRYIVIAHSLGSVMSFDALLYAHAPTHVRCGKDPDWVFPGYLPDGVTDNEKHDLCKLDNLRAKKDADREALSEAETTALQYLGKKFAFPKTDWIERVESFVTIGSPIDKYLTIWWLNYRYLSKNGVGCQLNRSKKISHFNYCDELDPVGHNLDVAHQKPAYEAVFKWCEDIVFNRYAVPGAAHNKYWKDQELFGWILDRAVDKDCVKAARSRPRWFNPWVYCKLLFWLYCAVPFLVLVGTYASLSLAFQASDWRTAAVAAAGFSFLAHFGRRLIDLGIWWRQIQRQESESSWKRKDAGDNSESDKRKQPCAGGPDPKQRYCRSCGTWMFRILVSVVPIAWGAVVYCLLDLDLSALQRLLVGGSASRPALVAVVAAVVFGLLALRSLPKAYRVQTVNWGVICSVVAAGIMVLVCVALGSFAAPLLNQVLLPLLTRCDVELEQAALFGVLATIIYVYRLVRFIGVKIMLRLHKTQGFVYSKYATHP